MISLSPKSSVKYNYLLILVTAQQTPVWRICTKQILYDNKVSIWKKEDDWVKVAKMRYSQARSESFTIKIISQMVSYKAIFDDQYTSLTIVDPNQENQSRFKSFNGVVGSSGGLFFCHNPAQKELLLLMTLMLLYIQETIVHLLPQRPYTTRHVKDILTHNVNRRSTKVQTKLLQRQNSENKLISGHIESHSDKDNSQETEQPHSSKRPKKIRPKKKILRESQGSGNDSSTTLTHRRARNSHAEKIRKNTCDSIPHVELDVKLQKRNSDTAMSDRRHREKSKKQQEPELSSTQVLPPLPKTRKGSSSFRVSEVPTATIEIISSPKASATSTPTTKSPKKPRKSKASGTNSKNHSRRSSVNLTSPTGRRRNSSVSSGVENTSSSHKRRSHRGLRVNDNS